MRQTKRASKNTMMHCPSVIWAVRAASRIGPLGKSSRKVPSSQPQITNNAVSQCRICGMAPYCAFEFVNCILPTVLRMRPRSEPRHFGTETIQLWPNSVLADGVFDPRERCCHIRLHIAVKYSQHGVVMRFEPIAFLRARFGGNFAFLGRHQIDHQPQRKRHEVADVLADRRLPLETAAGEAAVVDERLP